MPSVLISGCSSGIGRALAEAFRAASWQVFACAHKVADVEKLAQAGEGEKARPTGYSERP